MYDKDGLLRGFAKVTRDVTENVLVERALRDSEERFRLLVEGVEDYAIVMLDPVGRVVSWNHGAHRITQFSTNDVIGQHFSLFFTREDVVKERPAQVLATAIQKGHITEDVWRVRKDNTRFFANSALTVLRSEQTGQIRGFAMVLRDITEKMMADQALKESGRFRLLVESVGNAIFLLNPGSHHQLERYAGLRPFLCSLRLLTVCLFVCA